MAGGVDGVLAERQVGGVAEDLVQHGDGFPPGRRDDLAAAPQGSGVSRTIVTIWCLPADVVDSSTVASLGATQNFFSNIGSALSPIIIGALYGANGSFELPLVLTGAVVIAGALCFSLLIKKVEPLSAASPHQLRYLIPRSIPSRPLQHSPERPALPVPCTTGKSFSPVPN